MGIYNQIIESKKKGRKLFSILIDPDKQTEESLLQIIKKSKSANVDLFFVGGSLLTNNSLDSCITIIKQNCKIPVVLFPGNTKLFRTYFYLYYILSERNSNPYT